MSTMKIHLEPLGVKPNAPAKQRPAQDEFSRAGGFNLAPAACFSRLSVCRQRGGAMPSVALDHIGKKVVTETG